MNRYSPEIAKEICDRLAAGESLRAICDDAGTPARSTVLKWLTEHAEFSDQYAIARDAGLDVMADHVIEISDQEPGTLDNGGTDTGRVAANRLRMDARRWYLSKLAPKRYGDRLNVEHSGAVAISTMTEEEIRAELAALVSGVVAVPQNDSIDDCDDLI
jgi:hypothetical protein